MMLKPIATSARAVHIGNALADAGTFQSGGVWMGELRLLAGLVLRVGDIAFDIILSLGRSRPFQQRARRAAAASAAHSQTPAALRSSLDASSNFYSL